MPETKAKTAKKPTTKKVAATQKRAATSKTTRTKTAKKPAVKNSKPTLSVVVPMFNEQENIVLMADRVEAAMKGINYELIFVDDGSNDNTVKNITEQKRPNVRVICFARNFGQTSAMAAGIEHAKGEFIATLDGDLQNDPDDIPMMLNMLQEQGLDLVHGKRKNRKDGMILRKIPSKIANKMIRKMSNVHISDYGCSLKVFRAHIAKNLDLYGELHRFIPILASIKGAKIAEVDVKHHARQFGVSKYGLGRTFRVASDLMLMAFFLRYRQKPMHLFGTMGLFSLMIGGLMEAYLLVLKLFGEDIGGRPLFYVGILLIMMGVQFITTGFIAELLMRTYFSAEGKRPYVIAKAFVGDKEDELA